MTRDTIAAEEQRCRQEWHHILRRMSRAAKLKTPRRSKWLRYQRRNRNQREDYGKLSTQSRLLFDRLEGLWDTLEMIDRENVSPLLALLACK